MKSTLRIVFITLAIIPLFLYGQTTFIPVLTEGKSWEVATFNIDNDYIPVDTTGYYSIIVGGDTIVNDLTCKKIEIVPKSGNKSAITAVAYEENGKVWNIREDGVMELLYDINLHQYDFIEPGFVVTEDYIHVNGVKRKRLCVDSGIDSNSEYGSQYYHVVEGIGISTNHWIFMSHINNEYAVMLSCSENGEVIFTKEDFTSTPSAIDAVATVKTVSSVRYYNLAGMESAEPREGVSIKVTTYTDGTRKCEKVVR